MRTGPSPFRPTESRECPERSRTFRRPFTGLLAIHLRGGFSHPPKNALRSARRLFHHLPVALWDFRNSITSPVPISESFCFYDIRKTREPSLVILIGCSAQMGAALFEEDRKRFGESLLGERIPKCAQQPVGRNHQRVTPLEALKSSLGITELLARKMARRRSATFASLSAWISFTSLCASASSLFEKNLRCRVPLIRRQPSMRSRCDR